MRRRALKAGATAAALSLLLARARGLSPRRLPRTRGAGGDENREDREDCERGRRRSEAREQHLPIAETVGDTDAEHLPPPLRRGMAATRETAPLMRASLGCVRLLATGSSSCRIVRERSSCVSWWRPKWRGVAAAQHCPALTQTPWRSMIVLNIGKFLIISS